MKQHNLIYSCILLWATAGCSEETIEKPLVLQGEVKGKVTLNSEFGQSEADHGGATVSVSTPEGPIVATSDEDGRFSLQGVPTGRYNLVVGKEGYASHTLKGFTVMGGDKPVYAFLGLYKPSTSVVNNLSLTATSQGLSFTGTLVHNNVSSYPFIRLVTFYSNKADISPENYAANFYHTSNSASGSQITWAAPLNKSLFPSGSTVYAVVCGYSGQMAYNPETGGYQFVGLGPVSAVVSAPIP